MTHTPGVWKALPWSEKEAQIVASIGGKRSLICAGVLNDDAKLMAASKPMLLALQAAEDFVATIQTEEAQAIYQQVHAAIARATTASKEGE